MRAIPLDGSVLDKEEKDGGRGSLVGTGAVWDACEEVMALKALGVVGVCVRKVESWRELVKDALEELREWGEEEGSDEGEDDGEAGSDDEDGIDGKGDDAQDIADSLFNNDQHIPRSDPDKIRPRLEATLRRLRLVGLLYAALIKRRFKSLPSKPGKSIIETTDKVLAHLKKIPGAVDDLASAFYDLDPEEVDTKMNECFQLGREAAEMAERNWKGEEDEFTTWVSFLLSAFPFKLSCFDYCAGWT